MSNCLYDIFLGSQWHLMPSSNSSLFQWSQSSSSVSIFVNGTYLSPVLLARTLESLLTFLSPSPHIQSITNLVGDICNHNISQILSHFSVFTTLGKLPVSIIWTSWIVSIGVLLSLSLSLLSILHYGHSHLLKCKSKYIILYLKPLHGFFLRIKTKTP